MKYSLSNHAVDVARIRWGIEPGSEDSWINQVMKEAKYINSQTVGKKSQLIYEYEEMRIVVGYNNTVITIKPITKADFLKPIFEREYRKLKRDVTKVTRSLELAQAETMKQMAENAINKARARNPKTRESIQKKIEGLQRKIESYSFKIKQEQDKVINFEKVTKIYE